MPVTLPKIEKELRHLEDATRLIAQGEALVGEQMRRLEQLREAGYPTLEAERVLKNFEVVLRTILDTENLIQHALRDIEAGKLPDLGT